jgi:NodT family efflux transporter outer membrane factor (OMF) lipoprotein
MMRAMETRESMSMLIVRGRWERKLAVPATLALLVLVSGCNVGPKYHAPTAPAVTAPNYKESTVNFKDQDGWKVASPQEATIRGNWWEIFNEPELNTLEEQLNANNQSIQVSYQNYMAARALIAEARSQYWPQVTFNPAWSRSRTSPNVNNGGSNVASGGGAGTKGSTSSLWTLPIDVTWTPDFWGKIRNEVREAQYSAQSSAADLALVKLSMQASLAQFYFEIRGQDKLIVILDATVKADKEALDATQGAYDAGTGDYVAVVQAKGQWESAQASLVNAGLLRAQYEHAIAMLVGKIATDFSIPARAQIYTAPPIPLGVPSQLAERRPDVAEGERKLAADNATIGIGYGAFFPQVTLSAAGALESSTFMHLFDIASRVWSIGPTASQVIFDGGLYRAQLHQYEAQYNADVANYRQTVLTAFQQVEDSLAATRIYSQQILHQQEAVKLAQQSYDLEKERYNAGVDPYIDVVTAQTTLLGDQVTLNNLQVQETLSAVQLVQALGGGWDASQLPTPAQAGAKVPSSAYTMQR